MNFNRQNLNLNSYICILSIGTQENFNETISTDDSNLNLVEDSNNEEDSKNSEYKAEFQDNRESQKRVDQENRSENIVPNILISSLEVIDEEEIHQTR